MKTLLLLALSIVPLCAQGMPPGRGPHPDRPRNMEKFHEKLQQLRLERLQQSMNLPDEKAKALVDRWMSFDRDFMERGKQIRRLRERFNEILMGPGSEDDKNVKVTPLLEQYLGLRRQQMELKAKFEEEIRSQLAPAQQVRFMLLVEDFQRNLRESLMETVKEGRPGRRDR